MVHYGLDILESALIRLEYILSRKLTLLNKLVFTLIDVFSHLFVQRIIRRVVVRDALGLHHKITYLVKFFKVESFSHSYDFASWMLHLLQPHANLHEKCLILLQKRRVAVVNDNKRISFVDRGHHDPTLVMYIR